MEEIRYFPASDYQHALIVLPIGLVASAVFAYFLDETRFGSKSGITEHEVVPALSKKS